MSINYTTLFTRIGKFIKYSNVFLAEQSTLVTDLDDISDEYDARRDLITNLQGDYNSFISFEQNKMTNHQSYITTTLQDLQAELFAPSNAINTILEYMYNDMVTNSQSVNPTAVGAVTITPYASNIGKGVLIASKTNLKAADDQRIIAETIKLTCTSDVATGTNAGSEIFEIVGQPIQQSTSYLTQGNGNSTITGLSNSLTNGDFEAFTVANTPDDWTINNGTVGTHIFSSTGSFRGTTALKLKGDATGTTINLSQVFPNAAINTIYVASVWLKKGATVPTGSVFNVKITGTAMSDVTLFSADPNTLTTSYVHYNAFFKIPDPIPTDLTVSIGVTDAVHLTSSDELYVDNFFIGTPTDFGHVQYALIPGSADFIIGDYIDVTTAVTTPGTIQTYFTRFYDFELPSDATETIADSLAT